MFSYKLMQSIPAVTSDPSGGRIVSIACGSLLIVPDTDKEGGLVDVFCDGAQISVFIQDVRERGYLVRTAGV